MGKGFSKLLKCAVLCVAIAAVTGCTKPGASVTTDTRNSGTRADLILITIDTLRADHVGHLGGDPKATPALDRLARAGVTFLDATAHAPLTLPAHASIMTARYPPHHGIRDNAGFVLNDATPTLASILKGAGYHTAAFVSSYVLRAGSGLARGFDVYDERFDGLGTDHLTLTSLERRGPEVARAAVAWLAHAPRPYFLWVHFYDPHAPYDPPPAFGERFPGRPYDGEIATSDFGVATLLDALPTDRSGTIVVATGDHGEGLGDHGESQHGILLYDSTLHVPLIMTGPGIPPDVRVTRQVRHVDVLPTILAMAGIPVPAGVDGASLQPLLDRTPARPTDEAPLAYAETQFGLLHFGWAPLASGRDGRWKYIDAPAPELYDLGADRSETANRFAPGGTAAGIARKVREIGSTSQPLRARAGDTDVRERLRSLGYASGRVDLGSPSGSGDPKIEIVRYEAYVQAFNDGLMRLESGQPKAAEAVFRELARTFPGAFEAHQYLARALAAQGAFDAAVKEFEVALALSPNEPTVYFDSARALASQRKFEAAFDRVAAGRRQDPRSFYGALVEGLVAKAAGDVLRAERAFTEAVALNPALAAAHFELGLIAESRGQAAAAEAAYRKALEGDPLSNQARTGLDRVTRRGK
jgi:arylsulfatase A-like enzyme/Tfp pilus assembly protein PilF